MPHGRLAQVVLLAALVAGPAVTQDFRVYTEHPRLFLQPRKLGLLQKERERQSPRWRQFESVVKSGASLPEPGLANALYSQVSGDTSYCAKAVDWALTGAPDLRELALVFDWCQPALTAEKSEALARKMEGYMNSSSGDSSISPAPGRLLAAIALAEMRPALSEQQVRLAVEQWWRGEAVLAIKKGRDPVYPDRMPILFEVLHAVRDNLKLDLRESAPEYFRDFAASRPLSYYPNPVAGPENTYRILATRSAGRPDFQRAAQARATDLCLAAYDTNSEETQFLQGWLMPDPLMMRSPFGAVYEFLWANPYQPGLAYRHSPLHFHSASVGTLFARSSWDEDATWLGYLGGVLQVHDASGLKIVTGQPASKPIRIGNAAVYALSGERSFRGTPPEVDTVYFLGLRPNAAYTVEVQGEKKSTGRTDPGGILAVGVLERPGAEVRIREQ